MKKVYLDMNIYNRPFDDQLQLRIKLETIAVFAIFQMIKDHDLSLAWSFILNYENSLNPYDDIRMEIETLSSLSSEYIEASENIRKDAQKYELQGIKPRDALHLSCALKNGADYFITCDDKIITKRDILGIDLTIINPVGFVLEMETIKHENNERHGN